MTYTPVIIFQSVILYRTHVNYGCSYYSGGSYVRGAGVYLNGTASIVGSTIRNNSNTGSGAGIYVVGTNNTNLATVTDCLIEGNNSTDDGAGIYSQYANVVNTIVRNNVSSVYGGGVYATNYSYYADCLIANNTSARNGAGVYASTSTYFTNCDIVNNLNTSTSYNGAGFYANSSNINVINSVIWGNKRSTYADNVYNASSSSYLTLTYSAVEGGWNGVGNIALDCVNEGSMLSPAFENPTEGCGANYTGGDWTVKETSILINKGAETGLYSELPLTDLAGNTRLQQDRLDIGCYESAYTASHEIHCDEHNIIYVTVEGAGLKDGSSWENATDNLNFAITEATAMEPIPVIWVAAGTYTGENAATSAFIMQPGVSVYGGFQGNEAYDFDLTLRDFDDYQTILDGQNSRRVLEQKADYSASKAVVWDGFVIERGRLSGGSGAGAYLLGNSTLRNCIIRNDTIRNGSVYGAGLYLSNATLENCEVYGNYGYYNNSTNYGGGVYASNATIRNCYIHDNKVASNSTSYGMGGGIYCNSNMNTITGCVIVRNSSNKEGGGIYAYGNSSNYTNITNCRIENNTSYEGGGISGVYYFNVVGCNIANNTATYHGGGVSVSGNCTFVNTNIVNNLCTNTSSNVGSGLYLGSNGTRKLTNCIIWGNKKNQTSDQYYFSGTPTVTYCAIQGGYDGTGNITLSAENEGGELHPCFNNPTEDAGAEFSDGDWTLSMASVCINQGTTADLTLPETDLAGNERIQQGAIDMGAFESEFNAVVLTPDANHILYVSVEGAGAMDGSSWANATPYLQLAVNRAGTFQPKADVWVKEGTYVGNGVTGGNAFTIPQGIAVYGGFAGNETDFAQRDFESHVTVLDGQGVQRVLYQRTDFAAANAAVWDGFTLTNGVGEGAGAYLQANGEIRNCRVYGNGSTNSNSNGGGVRLYGSTSSGYAYMTNCYVYENNGYSGGGVYSSSGSITNCLIYGNEAQHNGGGVFVENYTSICFSTIVDNRCGNSYNGGGVYVNGSSSNSMRNTIVWGNKKGEGRNAIYNPGYIDIQYSALENGAVGLGNINLSANNTGDVMSPCFNAPENQIWTLNEGSIIINKGLDIDGITADMVGNSRVQQGAPDMGAFETGYTSGFDIVPDASGIIYVSTEGTGNGSSWANACGDLQFAINRAGTMNPVPQVWVKAGIYYSEMLASSNSAFSMVAGVNVFGGFAGNESADYDLSQRDFVTHATILDGRNAQRVLYQKYNFTETTPATWDGFTIRNGYVNGNGAGVYMQAYAHLKNCIITDNATTGSGTEGGGVYSTGLSAAYNTITNCEIRNNQSVYEGGGIRMEYTTLTNSIVNGNTSTSSSGGGIYSYYSKTINCLVSNNSSYNYGGGIYNYYSHVINTTIVNNNARSNGGGIYSNTSSSYTLANLIVWGNKVGESFNQYYSGSFTYSAIQGSQPSGTGNINLAAENDGDEVSKNYVRFLAPDFGIYQLQNESSLVGRGNNSVTGLPEKDLAGRDRIIDGSIEPGAYEQYCTQFRYMDLNVEAGSPYDFYGSFITEPGVYMHQWAYAADCDSLVIANVSMNSAIWYVTENGAGNKDGSSWANASDNLINTMNQAGMATGYGSKQIWVAEGTYAGNASGVSFPMMGGLKVFGGFAGNETSLAERDLENHQSILQGASNQYFTSSSSSNPCVEGSTGSWDGFTMRIGRQIQLNAYTELQNCLIEIPVSMSGASLENCEFANVSASNLVAVSATNASIRNCTFHNVNTNRNVVSASNSTIIGCEFDGNATSNSSYPMFSIAGGSVDSCSFHHNNAAGLLVKLSDAALTYGLIYNNTGKYNSSSSELTGSIISASNDALVSHCTVVNNRSNYSGTISPSCYVNMEDGSNNCFMQPKYTTIALQNAILENSIVWGNAQNVFENNIIAKNLASEINYCAIQNNVYNGIGNIALSQVNEDNVFAP